MSRDFQQLNPPPGYVPGCLPRAEKVGKLGPVFSDHIKIVERGEWDRILAGRKSRGTELNGRKDVARIKNQRSVGSCATEATAQAVEVEHIRQCKLDEWEQLNPWSIYRVTSGGSDRGSNIDRNLEFARDVGVLPVSFFPRYEHNDEENGRIINSWNARPPSGWEEVAKKYRIDEWYDMESIAEVGTALLLGFPVVIGWNSHSEVLVDLLPGEKALVANSWSQGWGDAGFHTEPLSKINWSYGAFAVRTVVDRGL